VKCEKNRLSHNKINESVCNLGQFTELPLDRS